MKKSIITIASMMLAAGSVHAFQIRSAKLDSTQKNILIDVTYTGGCKEHKFKLEMHGCAESMPVQCQAVLADVTPELDSCEAIVGKTVSISLKASGLDEDYYSNGSLTISSKSQPSSKATLRLPTFTATTSDQQPSDGTIQCLTHTGSNLLIQENQVRLLTKQGDSLRYSVISKDQVSIETYPTIDQTTYSMDDGRKIITEFRSDKNSGEGYFVRTNGEASPTFECSR